MKRRRKRKLFGKRNHYRQPVARKLSTGLENLERRALLTGLVGWGEVIDGDPGMDKEEVAFEKMSQKGDRGHFEKRASVNLKKLKMQKERQATFKQADLDFADFQAPSGRDYTSSQGQKSVSPTDYTFVPYPAGGPNALIIDVHNPPNEHYHQDSNENGRENINTFVYDNYTITLWQNPDGWSMGEVMIEDDDEAPSGNEGNTDNGSTTPGSNGNQGAGGGSTAGGGTYSDTSSDDDVDLLPTPLEDIIIEDDLEEDDPPVTEGEGEGEDEGGTEGDDEGDDDNGEEDDEEEGDGGNSGGENESNDVVLLPTPLDEIIIEDDTGDGDDNDSGGGGGEDEGDNETIECPDPPPGGSAPTHPDC